MFSKSTHKYLHVLKKKTNAMCCIKDGFPQAITNIPITKKLVRVLTLRTQNKAFSYSTEHADNR